MASVCPIYEVTLNKSQRRINHTIKTQSDEVVPLSASTSQVEEEKVSELNDLRSLFSIQRSRREMNASVVTDFVFNLQHAVAAADDDGWYGE